VQTQVKDAIETISMLLEIVGVAVILLGFAYASLRALGARSQEDDRSPYTILRATFGRSILLGLEILVAADLILTIAIEPTLDNLSVLAVLIALRTFLSFSLEVEIDGRWPWQRAACVEAAHAEKD